jgi:CheY-like chemotaxis protein
MDDEEVLLEMVAGLLRAFGYQVVSARNGREVLDFYAQALKASRPIVAMMFDLTVAGGMGGKEAIGEIRKLGATMPIFVASGYADDPVMARPRDFGFTDSIEKPFTSKELSRMLNAHLGHLLPA